MKKHPTYKNPPIIEALIDIKVTQSEDVTVGKIELLHEKIKNEYPQKNTRGGFMFQIQLGEKPEGSARNLDVNGFLFKSKDERKIVQFRKDGFTFSQLKPYK